MVKKGDNSDTVYLNPSELKLFNLLKSFSADPLQWLSLNEIQAKLKLPNLEDAKRGDIY